MNSALVMCAMIFASVVLPVPGGPQKTSEPVSSRSTCVRSGLPGTDQVLLPDELLESTRAHAVGQRTWSVGRATGVRDGLEETHGMICAGWRFLLAYQYR